MFELKAIDKLIRDSSNLNYFFCNINGKVYQVPMTALFGDQMPVDIVFSEDIPDEEIEVDQFYAVGANGVYDNFIEGTDCHAGGRWYRTETGWKYIEPYWYTEGNIQTYEHDQGTPADEWIINHPMKKRPSVTVFDSAGTCVVGQITYIDINQVIINFSAAFSGKAVLN